MKLKQEKLRKIGLDGAVNSFVYNPNQNAWATISLRYIQVHFPLTRNILSLSPAQRWLDGTQETVQQSEPTLKGGRGPNEIWLGL